MVTDIKNMVLGFMDSIKVSVTGGDDGIYRAQVPPNERVFFNEVEVYTFTFDRETAQKCREAEYLGDGSYFLRRILERLSAVPKVSRLFRQGEPETVTPAPATATAPGNSLRVLQLGQSFYRQQVLFTFKVIYSGHCRVAELVSVLVDPFTGTVSFLDEMPDLTNFSEEADTSITVHEQTDELLKSYLQTLAQIEAKIKPQIDTMREQAKDLLKAELIRIDQYFDEQKRELQQKKENVYFHLYFFQKEEEIDKMMRDLESERARKTQEMAEKYELKIEVVLVNALVLCIPTRNMLSSTAPRREAEAPKIKAPTVLKTSRRDQARIN